MSSLSLEVLGRDSETQLQVGENLNYIISGFMVNPASVHVLAFAVTSEGCRIMSILNISNRIPHNRVDETSEQTSFSIVSLLKVIFKKVVVQRRYVKLRFMDKHLEAGQYVWKDLY